MRLTQARSRGNWAGSPAKLSKPACAKLLNGTWRTGRGQSKSCPAITSAGLKSSTEPPGSPPVLKLRRLARNQSLHLAQELCEGHRASVAFTARSHAHRVGFGFLVAHYQQVRYLLHREVADF